MNETKFDSCIKLIKESDTMVKVLSELSQESQESQESQKIGVFEPEIKFIPSYKFVGDKYSIVGSGKTRIPGYADRILFRRGNNEQRITPNTDYQLITSATISDHKPVTCSFTVTLPNVTLPNSIIKTKVRIITWNIGSGDNGQSANDMIIALQSLVQLYTDCEYIVLTLQEANDDLYRALEKRTIMGEYTINALKSALSSIRILGKKIYYKLVTIILKKTTDIVPSGGSPVIDNFDGILNGLKITKGKFHVNTKGAFNTTLHFGTTGVKVHIINLHFPFDDSIRYTDFKTQLNALFNALNDGEWCIMAGDYNSRSNIILDENGSPIDEIKKYIFDSTLKAIFGKGLQVHPINPNPLQKTKPTEFLPPSKSLESYQELCNKLYKFYSEKSQQLLPPDTATAYTGGNKPRKTRKYKKLVTRKNKKHTNKLKKYKKYKYILRRRTNKKRKH